MPFAIRPIATLISWLFPTWAVVEVDHNTMYPDIQDDWDKGDVDGMQILRLHDTELPLQLHLSSLFLLCSRLSDPAGISITCKMILVGD